MPDAGESTTDRRQKLAEYHDSISSADSKNDLIGAINNALSVSAPVGDPGVIEGLAKTYRKQIDDVADVQRRVQKVANEGLPDAWVGSTGARASEVVMAAARSAEQMEQAFSGAAGALFRLADALTNAKSQDKGGREQLREALGMLGGEDGFFDDMVEKDAEEAERLRARNIAATGARTMHSAAVVADDAARAAARDLNKLASEARAGQMQTDNISAADRLVLADIAGPGGPAEMNELLTANDLERSGRAMERLDAREEAEFERMLAEAKTPQERAYLVKALAAGYDVKEVGEFRDKIHGKDPAWLQRHLTPVTTAGDSMNDEGVNTSGPKEGSNHNTDQQTFNGERWSQEGNTCVPSTVVTGRAMVDPVYALELTGGPSGQEDDPGAFRERLRDEQHRMHDEGDGNNEYDFPFGSTPDGMDNDGKTEISNKEISPHTGGEYEFQEVRSADDRRDALPDIERAVAEGRPVPIGVEGKDEDGDRVGHSMMIIGQEGDMLQVYNPWGTTTWVSEDDFVNGNMGKASDKDLPDAYGVHLPAQ
ncbi:WXG100 family type VII secretion target [Streptomyces chartreusis]|uniref:WXG100 family type VII secretion target n=1 Tax=Streptomyces chartreusis TaxID=1969 RepID=A0A7H8TDJ3_STRCX|nr:WXG100 family type VII secretion target [Streptomyces chartreusis]QKZ21571.1 WXG100 family type VII secretion target [Streptomyces chartreusis]